MGALEFISKMAEVLAWPIVAVVIAIIFRKSLARAMAHLRTLKLPGGTEMAFGEEMRAAVKQAAAIEPASAPVAKENDERLVQLMEMAAISPTGAIVEAWKDVETAARQVAEVSGLPMRSSPERPHFSLQSFLLKNELLPHAELETFKELRLLRNKAAHSNDNEITVEQARQYVRLADRLVDAMRALELIPNR